MRGRLHAVTPPPSLGNFAAGAGRTFGSGTAGTPAKKKVPRLRVASRDKELCGASRLRDLFSPNMGPALRTAQPSHRPDSQTAQNDVRVESRWHYVSQLPFYSPSRQLWPRCMHRGGSEGPPGGGRTDGRTDAGSHKTDGANTISNTSYNRYLAVAARAVRRSLKEDKRLLAERRGQQDLKFAKWTVSMGQGRHPALGELR